jgi:hypothetical protein
LTICAVFFARGGVVFFGVFSTKLVCKRGVLHGKHRELVVKTWWETDIKSALKNETGFRDLFSV